MRIAINKAGVPYDTAMSMPIKMALAHLVAQGEADGDRWDWHSMTWEGRK